MNTFQCFLMLLPKWSLISPKMNITRKNPPWAYDILRCLIYLQCTSCTQVKSAVGSCDHFLTLKIEKIAKQLLFRCYVPPGIYLLKVNNGNIRPRCEICSKLTIKTPERRLATTRLFPHQMGRKSIEVPRSNFQ